MGLFGKKEPVIPVETEMDADWFFVWSEGIRTAKGLAPTVEFTANLYDKASAVIDHDCRDYLQEYGDSQSLKVYGSYFASDELTPWGLISVVVALNLEKADWEDFIVSDMKQKLHRFGEILINPDIVR